MQHDVNIDTTEIAPTVKTKTFLHIEPSETDLNHRPHPMSFSRSLS